MLSYLYLFELSLFVLVTYADQLFPSFNETKLQHILDLSHLLPSNEKIMKFKLT